jgi:hypothetical protein
MHRVEGFLGFGAHLDERSDLVRFYVYWENDIPRIKYILNGPILSDFMFLEVYWEIYINCQMHFFQWSDLVRFLFLFFCASSGNIFPASSN